MTIPPSTELLAQLRTLQSLPAVYMERRWICLVSIAEINLSESGISITVKPMTVLSGPNEHLSSFFMEGEWEIVSISRHLSISLAWLGAVLVTDPANVAKIQERATSLEGVGTKELDELIMLINGLR